MADVSLENGLNSAHRKPMVVEITQGQNVIGSGFCGKGLRSTEVYPSGEPELYKVRPRLPSHLTWLGWKDLGIGAQEAASSRLHPF